MFRKMIPAIAATFLAVISCQKSDFRATGSLSVTATIAQSCQSRVSYEMDGNVIKPAWNKGDEIFGYDSQGNSFTFTVTDVNKQGSAVIDAGGYTPEAGTKLYAVYYPGKGVGDIIGEEIEVDLSSQTGKLDATSPLIMCATGSVVSDGSKSSVSLNFYNQTAIVGVKQFKVDAGASVTGLSLNGVIGKGRIARGTDGFSFIPDGEISKINIQFSPALASDAAGVVDRPQYFIVAPQEDAEVILYARSASETFVNQTDIATFNITAGNYYYMTKKMGEGKVEVPELGMVFPSVTKAVSRIENTGSPCTIRLIADCQDDTLTLNCPAKVTIDLNGHTLETSMTISGKVEINDSSNGAGKMLITQAKSDDGDVYGRNIFLTAGSELTINGGTFTGRTSSPSSYDHIQIINCNGTSSERVKVTVNKANFIGRSQAGIMLVTQADVVVNDGDFNSAGTYGRNFRVRAGGKVTINGGTYYSDVTNVIQFSSNADSNSSATVTGGKLSSNGVLFNFGSSKNVKLTVSGGNMATPGGVEIFGGSYLSNGTKTVTGGKFTADCQSTVPAASGYSWKKLSTPDTQTIPGHTLTHQVVKN